MALDDSELVERTRLAANEVCEKAKLALRPLLPGVEALQKDNTHFSPRLMLLMLSRAGEKLALQDRERLEHILVHAEAFQPQLITWMSSVRDKTAGTGSPADGAKCADAIQLMTKHLADLDVLLDKVGGERRTS